MAKHRHKMRRARGPYGCAGGVKHISICSCGAERKTCDCTQCEQQNTSDSGWFMPACLACKLKHPADEACDPSRRPS